MAKAEVMQHGATVRPRIFAVGAALAAAGTGLAYWIVNLPTQYLMR